MSADPLAPALSIVAPPSIRLTHDIDVWVASASADGAPYLVPLSFSWDGEALMRDGDPEAPRAEAKENQTYCSKLVISSQATPTETAKAAPPSRWSTMSE